LTRPLPTSVSTSPLTPTWAKEVPKSLAICEESTNWFWSAS